MKNIIQIIDNIKNKRISSSEIQSLISFINEEGHGINDISEDEIEYLKLFVILLNKLELMQNNTISITEWRNIGESAYHKLKKIIKEIEYMQIITSTSESTGGHIWFRIIEKTKFRNYLLYEIVLIVKKIKISKKDDINNLNLFQIRKYIIERVDPDLNILETWLTTDKTDDFESAITKLLWLCGFSSIHVGDKYEQATLKNRRNKFSKSSVNLDVIATIENDNKQLILCQCSTDLNLDKIRNLADILSEIKDFFVKINYNVKIYGIVATTISETQIQSSIEFAESLKVKILYKERLLNLLKKIKESDSENIQDIFT